MRALKSGFLAALAVVTCPCHLPLLLVLMAGTSAGAWLARYQGPVFGVMVVVFAVSLYMTFCRLGEGGANR